MWTTHLAGELYIRNLHDGSQIGITCMHYLMPPQLLGALYFFWSECTIFVDLTSNRIALCLMVLGEGLIIHAVQVAKNILLSQVV